MKGPNITEILSKITELRALFVFGQRTMPFLEELFTFIQEMIPIMEEMNTSVMESTKKMPRVSSQINSVTQATELATTEILDLIDGLMNGLSELKNASTQSTESLQEINTLDARMIRLLKAELKGKNDLLFDRIQLLHDQKKLARKKLATLIEPQNEKIDAMNTMAYNIMISLQVQDITSQQLEAVNHLVTSIQGKLGKLLGRFSAGLEGSAASAAAAAAGPRPNGDFEDVSRDGTFNPDATYDKARTGQQQSVVDSLIQNGLPAGTPSPSIMPGYTAPAATPPASPSSQNDIDQLFGGGGSASSDASSDTGGPTSQDDIDKLFN